MMERPIVSKPRMEEWKNDDVQISKLLQHIDSEVLNVDKWKFRLEHLNEHVTFDDILKNTQGNFIDEEWSHCMRTTFMALPSKLDTVKSELNVIFKRFILNLEERIKYIQTLDEHIDKLNDYIRVLELKNHKLGSEVASHAMKNRIEALEKSVKGMMIIDKRFIESDEIPPLEPLEGEDSEELEQGESDAPEEEKTKEESNKSKEDDKINSGGSEEEESKENESEDELENDWGG